MTEPEKQIHPIIRGMVGFAVAVIVATFAISFVPPAWALAVPIGNLFVIDLGDLPPWIGAIVAVVVYLEARKARKSAAAGVMKIEAVSVQIDGLLAERDKAKVKEGEAKEKLVGAEKAATLAQGQSEGRAERASVAAKSAPPNGAPLSVADDRTAIAGERVADATERSAEAQQRVANVAEEKK